MTQEEPSKLPPRGLYERLKSDDDSWELWAKIALGVLALQALAFAVAYLRLGAPSLYAHAILIPALGAFTLPMAFWGLLRTIFRPPVFRFSRTVAFAALVIVGFFGNQPIFTAPVSTEAWTSDQEIPLPFDGKWITLAGGDDKAFNYHATTPAHRWGYDFAPLVDGNRFVGKGEELEDHHCYGTPVRTPVSGTVVQAVGNEPDQTPGDFNAHSILGNHLIIRVKEGEYLFLAHLRQGSLAVGAGDTLQTGDIIGECGNSGRSITPNLHIHMQNTRTFPIGESLPLRFSNYIADGQPVAEGMPQGSPDFISVVGQIVENQ